MQQVIKNTSGETLDYTFTRGSETLNKQGWLVILGHGVTGNKDRPVVTDTAKALNAAGFDTLTFSFAGNGASKGDFRDAIISKETTDLGAVLDATSSLYSNICYIGHSMGAAVGVIQAAKDTRFRALVSVAGMVDTKSFAETEFGKETPDAGFMWEEESCPLSSAYMKDMCETIQTVAPQAIAISIPWLLLHGTADDVVNPRDTRQIESIKGNSVKAIYIEGADHSFNDPSHKQQMTQAIVSWLNTLI